jgi:hypothetical protein
MKAHVGVDSKTKMIHTVVATAANVADSTVLAELLRGEERRVWGDQAYRGQTEVIQQRAPQAKDCTHRQYRYKNRIDEAETGEEPDQVENALAGGTCVWGDETEVRVREGALPRPGEERQPVVRDLRPGKPVCSAQETAERGGITVCRPLASARQRQVRSEEAINSEVTFRLRNIWRLNSNSCSEIP